MYYRCKIDKILSGFFVALTGPHEKAFDLSKKQFYLQSMKQLKQQRVLCKQIQNTWSKIIAVDRSCSCVDALLPALFMKWQIQWLTAY